MGFEVCSVVNNQLEKRLEVLKGTTIISTLSHVYIKGSPMSPPSKTINKWLDNVVRMNLICIRYGSIDNMLKAIEEYRGGKL